MSDLCLRRYPFLSSFVKTKFQRIPAVLTRKAYEVKLSLTTHNFYRLAAVQAQIGTFSSSSASLRP